MLWHLGKDGTKVQYMEKFCFVSGADPELGQRNSYVVQIYAS